MRLFKSRTKKVDDVALQLAGLTPADLLLELHECVAALTGSSHESGEGRFETRCKSITDELLSRSLSNHIASICDSRDIIEVVVESLISGVSHSSDSRLLMDSVERVCLHVMLECVSQDEFTKCKAAANLVIGELPGFACFASLLSPQASFWVRLNAVELVGRLVELGGVSVAPMLLAASQVLSALVQLLSSTDSESALRDSAITAIRKITLPNHCRQWSDETADGIRRVLLFEGCLEQLLQTARTEGGVQLTDTVASTLAGSHPERTVVCSNEFEVKRSALFRACASGSSSGSPEIALDCLRSLRQLLYLAEGQKYFDMNDMAVHLCPVINFLAASKLFFCPLADRAKTAFLPPFVRRRSDKGAPPPLLVDELGLLETAAILLRMTNYRRSHHEEKFTKFLQQLCNAPPGYPSLIDSATHWIVSLSLISLAHGDGDGAFEVTSHGHLFLAACISLLSTAVSYAAGKKHLQHWLLEQEGDARRMQSLDEIAQILSVFPTSKLLHDEKTRHFALTVGGALTVVSFSPRFCRMGFLGTTVHSVLPAVLTQPLQSLKLLLQCERDWSCSSLISLVTTLNTLLELRGEAAPTPLDLETAIGRLIVFLHHADGCCESFTQALELVAQCSLLLLHISVDADRRTPPSTAFLSSFVVLVTHLLRQCTAKNLPYQDTSYATVRFLAGLLTVSEQFATAEISDLDSALLLHTPPTFDHQPEEADCSSTFHPGATATLLNGCSGNFFSMSDTVDGLLELWCKSSTICSLITAESNNVFESPVACAVVDELDYLLDGNPPLSESPICCPIAHTGVLRLIRPSVVTYLVNGGVDKRHPASLRAWLGVKLNHQCEQLRLSSQKQVSQDLQTNHSREVDRLRSCVAALESERDELLRQLHVSEARREDFELILRQQQENTKRCADLWAGAAKFYSHQ